MPTDNAFPFVPDARSDLLNSTHILLVTAESVEPGAWVRETGRFQKRITRCIFAFQEAWKGRVDEPPGGRVAIPVPQWECTAPRFVAVPGSWSGELLAPGARLVVFCNSARSTLAELLAEPACRKLEAAEAALPDLALASRTGKPPLPLAALIERTFAERDQFGYLFAQYLSARIAESLFHRQEDLDAVLRLIADPQLAERARWILLTDLYSQFLLLDPAPIGAVEQLLSATFRTLALPEAASLRSPMYSTYVPNLLGLEGGALKKSAREVYAGKPDELRAAEALLQSQQEQPGATVVLDWIRRAG